MTDKKVTKRELVKAEIEAGGKTKIEIAEALEMSVASVSSQMTYLRWMGLFIKYDEEKVLSFVTEEEFDAWQAELKANRKTTSVSNKTPEEQASAVAKTLKNQNAALARWDKKLDDANLMLDEDEDDEEAIEFKAESEANIVLLKIKIRRNETKAADLPDVPEELESEASDEDEDELL